MGTAPPNQGLPRGGSLAMGATSHQQLNHHGGHNISEKTLALAAYCLSSIAMTIVNKYVLSGHKFHLNFFLLMMQVGLLGGR